MKHKHLLGENDLKSLREYLVTNKPGVVEQRKIAKLLKEEIKTPGLFYYLKILTKNKNWIYRNFACHLIPYCFQKYKTETKRIILLLADDTDWRVRESITWALYQLLQKNFEEIYPLLKEWANYKGKKVRRAVIIAAMKVAKHRDEKLAIPLLEFLEPFLGDKDDYVQKALAFVIGDGFIRYYPLRSFSYLRKWARKDNIRMSQLIAKSLSTAEAVKQITDSLKVLKILTFKNDPDILNEVTKTLIKLAKKRPEEVHLEINAWRNNSRQRHFVDKIYEL